MAYYPKNKAKLKPAKEGEFIYQDDNTPFKGTYIKTSKGQLFEGEDINFPGRSIIPTRKRQQKNLLLSLLKNLFKRALTLIAQKLLSDLLASLILKLLNPGDIQQVEQAQEILNNAEGRNLTEQEQNQIKDLLDQIDYDEVALNNSVISNSNYNELNPGAYRSLNKSRTIRSTKIKPKDEDYSNGNYVRYFSRRINALNNFS